MRRIVCFVAVAALTFVAAPALAADGDDLEGILGGFEEDPDERAAEQVARDDDSGLPYSEYWDLFGSVQLSSFLNYLDHRATDGTEYEGISRLRLEVDLGVDLVLPYGWKGRIAGRGWYDFAYHIRGVDEYTAGVKNDYLWELDFTEVWVQGNLFENLDLKVGRQIVNWGRSDNLRVLDVLNPLDNLQPGLVDIEDLRRPVTMVRADYYIGDWSITGIAIPEIRFSQNPPFGSDFFPGKMKAPPQRIPNENLNNTEWAVAVNGIFRGWDVSFHYARIYEDNPHVRNFAPAGVPPRFKSIHPRLHMFGTGGNYTWGNWLVKGEMAFWKGLEFSNDPHEHWRLDTMAGLEYYGFEDATFVVEVVNRHLHNVTGGMRKSPDFAQQNRLETSFRATREFMNDRLRVTGVAIIFGERAQDGSVIRLQSEYELRDALLLTGGIVIYDNGNGNSPILGSYGKNDRLFASLRWSF